MKEIATQSQSIVDRLSAYKDFLDKESTKKSNPFVSLAIDKILADLSFLRKELSQKIASISGAQIKNLASIAELYQAIDFLRNCLFDEPLSQEEKKIISDMQKCISKGFSGNDAFRAYVLLSLYFSSYDLPLTAQWGDLPKWGRQRFLQLAVRQPHLMRKRDEKKYLNFYQRLSRWILATLEDKDISLKEKNEAIKIIQEKLGFGACYYVDQSVVGTTRYRAKIIQAVARIKGMDEFFKENKLNKKRKEGKIRLGILSRNRGDYTDTRALYALFNAFDKEKYQIYWYSLGIKDKSTLYTPQFDEELNAITHKYVELSGSAKEMAREILNDDLDVFVLGTAYSTGVKEIDLVLSGKLGRKQISLVALFPGSTSLPSFDYTIIPKTKSKYKNTMIEEVDGKSIEIDGPLLWYQKKDKARPSLRINRTFLGISSKQVIYMSGAAVNKQMDATLRTWLDVLRDDPKGVLVLFPFNPAWGGHFIALTFLARLRAVLKAYPEIDRERIKVIKQLSPEEGDQVLQQADVYLGSFPRDGGTMAMLSLRYGIPIVARREKWLHGLHDAQLLRSIGGDALIGENNKQITEIATHLGKNKRHRSALVKKINKSIETAPFFDHVNRSRLFQKTMDGLLDTPC